MLVVRNGKGFGLKAVVGSNILYPSTPGARGTIADRGTGHPHEHSLALALSGAAAGSQINYARVGRRLQRSRGGMESSAEEIKAL